MYHVSDLRFDDIDSINAAVSEDFGKWTPPMEITQDMINRFADLTGDHQWIHVDVERATAGPFGGPIAHGFLTLSLLPTLVLPALPLTGFRQVVNYGTNRLRFIGPVPADSQVRSRLRILGAEAREKGTLLKSEVEVQVIGADNPSLVCEMLAMYMG